MKKTGIKWKQHKVLVIFSVLCLIFFLSSIDFWQWNSSITGLFGFPIWVWYMFGLTLLLTFLYYLIIRFLWTEESS